MFLLLVPGIFPLTVLRPNIYVGFKENSIRIRLHNMNEIHLFVFA